MKNIIYHFAKCTPTVPAIENFIYLEGLNFVISIIKWILFLTIQRSLLTES